MLQRIRQYLRQRGLLLCLAGLLGIAYQLRLGMAPPRSEAGVAELLGEATRTTVAPDDFVWEHSRGPLLDAVWGRDVLFLGRIDVQPRDLYRATVRVTREGRPIEVERWWNLSQTALADEASLTVREHHAAYLVRAYDSVQAVTALDLSGRQLAALPRLSRWWASAHNWWRTGARAGVSRSEVAFEQPPKDARVQLRDGMLIMSLGEPPQPAALDLGSQVLAVDPADRFGVRSWRVPVLAPNSDASVAWLWLDRLSSLAHSRAEPLPDMPDGIGWPPRGSWQPGLHEDNPRLLRTVVAAGSASLTLVAIDTRRLRLGLFAGFDVPRPSVGARASGSLPEGVTPVALFNGVGAHDGGLVVGRRVLLPPRDGEATAAIDLHGTTRLGSWKPRGDLLSLRQAGPPLIADGAIANPPAGARRRSALCRTRDGYLIYAHSRAIDGAALAEALLRASCADALLLSSHAGMSANGALIAGDEAPRDPSPEDAFYLEATEIAPSLGDLDWKPDAAEQPPPEWMPAVHVAETALLGVGVSLTAIAVDRYRWDIRPGEREKAGATAERELEPSALAQAQIAISLGVGWRKDNRRGLVLDGVIALPIRSDLGVLSTELDGRLALRRSIDGLAPLGDASELPLLAEGGTVRTEAKRLGPRYLRGAACLLPDRTLVIARSHFDSNEPNTMALMDLGCERIAELNRGKQTGAFIHRAGSSEPPRASYDDTVLYGTSGRADGRARPMSD